MQLASYGTRAIPARHLSRVNPYFGGTGGAARAIHIPLPRPSGTTPTTAQRVVKNTRTLLGRFVAHLTAPGLRAPTTSFPTAARSLHTPSQIGIKGIKSNLSLPARHALSRGPFLPRAPAVQRSVTQVGLGTARNFSSARPIFQNLAQNVPVAGRAFWEADWEIHGLPRDEEVKLVGKENALKTKKTNEMAKPNKTSVPVFDIKSESELTESESELDHYFPASIPSTVNADLTTYLLIPLAPTPTSRLPLSASPPASTLSQRQKIERFLPLPQLATIHTTHSTHALRVSTLFARLDNGNVWGKGVSCDAYSSGGRHEGVCTVLRVSFLGWTAAEVRSVIGESGTGWCELQEVRADASVASSVYDEDTASESGMSDLSSHFDDERLNMQIPAPVDSIDPSQSFVLPTLDFSASFVGSPAALVSPALSRRSSYSSTGEADFDMFSHTSSDAFSDSGSDSSDAFSDSGSDSDSGVSSTFSYHDSSSSGHSSWMQPQPSWQGSSRFGFGFSSEFSGRLSEDGPMEAMF